MGLTAGLDLNFQVRMDRFDLLGRGGRFGCGDIGTEEQGHDLTILDVVDGVGASIIIGVDVAVSIVVDPIIALGTTIASLGIPDVAIWIIGIDPSIAVTVERVVAPAAGMQRAARGPPFRSVSR